MDPPLNLHELLHDCTIDLAVCGNFHIWPRVEYESLFFERMVAVVATDHPLAKRTRVRAADLSKYPGVNMFTGAISSRQDTKPITGLPSLDWASQIMVGRVHGCRPARHGIAERRQAPASLGEYLSSILPLVVLQLTGEETEIDTGMFWAPVQQDGPSRSGCGR